jgi:hypothetical protein
MNHSVGLDVFGLHSELSPVAFACVEQAAEEFEEYLRDLIGRRRVEPAGDSQQPTQISTHPSPRLHPTELTRDQLHHRIQRRDPPSKIHHELIITAGLPSA